MPEKKLRPPSREASDLIDEHEAAEQAVVEDEVDVEVIALERHALLSRDEAEALAKLEEEALDAIGDGLLEIALAPVGPPVEAEEFEDERVFQDVGRGLDLVSVAREREHLRLVAAFREALEQGATRFDAPTRGSTNSRADGGRQPPLKGKCQATFQMTSRGAGS